MTSLNTTFTTPDLLKDYVQEALGDALQGSNIHAFTNNDGRPSMEINFVHASSAAWSFGVLGRDPATFGVTMRQKARLLQLVVD